MNYKIFTCIVIVTILSSYVFASNAPPPIPTEYWGQAIIDGSDAPLGTLITSDYGNDTVLADGFYDLILTGGDSDLTNISDADCAIAWAASRGCIPCSTNPADPDYCIEGPQEGDEVIINLDGSPVSIIWGKDQGSTEKILSQVSLYSGWNMVGIPGEPLDNDIQNMLGQLTGTKLADYYNTASSTWERYNSGTPPFTWTLLDMQTGKGYWIRVDSDQKWTTVGTNVNPNELQLITGWNLVSFRLFNDSIENAMSILTGTRLADYYDTPTTTWMRYNSGTPPFTWTLDEVNIGKGYWVRVDSNQTWEEP